MREINKQILNITETIHPSSSPNTPKILVTPRPLSQLYNPPTHTPIPPKSWLPPGPLSQLGFT